MRWVFIGSIFILFLILISIGFQSVFGDKYGTLGIRHSDNPVVCIFEPDHLYTDKGEDID